MRGRPRTFDWDEARRLRESGMPVASIAARFAVSKFSIYTATNAEVRRRRYARNRKRLYSAICPDCEGPRNIYHSTCARCWHIRQTKVRDGKAWCPSCSEWKPLSEFARSSSRPARGVHTECRKCSTVRRQTNRAANLARDRAYDRERKRKLRAQRRATA